MCVKHVIWFTHIVYERSGMEIMEHIFSFFICGFFSHLFFLWFPVIIPVPVLSVKVNSWSWRNGVGFLDDVYLISFWLICLSGL